LTAGTVAARGSHAPPSLAAREPMRRRKKLHRTGRSGMASSPFPFLAGGDLQKQQNRNNQLILVFFFLCFQICFSFYRSVFFLFPLLYFRWRAV
jgi:hypothetical protein